MVSAGSLFLPINNPAAIRETQHDWNIIHQPRADYSVAQSCSDIDVSIVGSFASGLWALCRVCG